MEENHIVLIKKTANFLDYKNLCPKLGEAISSVNKRAEHIIITIDLLDHK